MNAGTASVTMSSLPLPGRLAMLLINYTALVQVILFASVLFIPYDVWWKRIIYAAGCLYLLPPLLSLPLRRLGTVREGTLAAGSSGFLVWWALFNLQVLFCRLPLLEELLRVVPGLYSLWLRLWGAKIGRLTYWAAGTVILDRSFVTIGNDVVFGAGVRINPHVMTINEAGEKEVILARVTIGDGAVVGGYSLLTAGTEIAAGECVRAYLISPPFSRWEQGRRVKETQGGAAGC